jgi:hypothetical protein
MGSEYTYAFAGTDSAIVNSIRNNSNTQDYSTNINNTVNGNLISGLNASAGGSNEVLTYGMMVGRNISLDKIASDLKNKNDMLEKNAEGTKHTYTRQGEINEWQAQNKLDTLFFLQIMFLYLCILVVCIFLRQKGMMSNSTVWIVIIALGLVVLGVLWNRASYTSTTRDKRHWNRRFIGLDDGGLNLSASMKCAMNVG